MGVCASSDNIKNSKKEENSSDNNNSKMMTKLLRLAFLPNNNSTTKKPKGDFIIISSPTLVKDNNRSISLGSHNNNNNLFGSENGSKEEAFFESKAWLDSDCDEDFLSVRGDFTPSQGNTPVHHNFSIGTPQINKSLFNDSSPEPSPNKKKRLSELFQESLREDKGADFDDQNNENMATAKVENKSSALGLRPKSFNGTTILKEKTVKSSQCCLPLMLKNRSFNERIKTSPAQKVG